MFDESIYKNMKKRLVIFAITLCFLSFSCVFNRESQKRHAEALKKLGIAYMTEGYYETSFEKLKAAEKLDKKDPILYNCLGFAYMVRKEYNMAIKNFKKAVKLNPKYSDAKNNLGTAYATIKEWDKAIKIFETVKNDNLYKTPHYPLTNIGWAYFNKKEYDTAEKYYKEALKLSPDFIIALYGLGNVYNAAGKYKEAGDLFKRVISIAPKSGIANDAMKKLYELVR